MTLVKSSAAPGNARATVADHAQKVAAALINRIRNGDLQDRKDKKEVTVLIILSNLLRHAQPWNLGKSSMRD